MKCQAKTHKPVPSNGIPKARPIVGAAHSLTTTIEDLLSDIIEPLARIDPSQNEAQSNEELLRAIQDANTTMSQVPEGKVVLASMDMVSLY